MSYWTATDDMLAANGGRALTCPSCDGEMFAIDDHGRFACAKGCNGLGPFARPVGLSRSLLPGQVDVTGMPDAEKAKIPPINRLHGTMTAAEQKLSEFAAKGPDGMDDPAYWETAQAVEAERAPSLKRRKKTKKK